MADVDLDTLTESQAARRDRVLRAALELGSEGGYDAVQMRAVSTRAGVALGTIYRYFSSKDHLLAEAMVEWVEDLERTMATSPPRGSTTADRVMDVLRRALKAMQREPDLATAVMTAQTSGEPEAGVAQARTSDAINRIMTAAFPDDAEPDEVATRTRVLAHVWFSCLVTVSNGLRDMAWVEDELDVAAGLLLAADA